MKDWGDSVSGIFVLLTPEGELAAHEPYHIVVWVTVPVRRYDNSSTLEGMQDAFLPSLEQLLGGLTGIVLQDLMLVSEADFTLDDVGRTRRMDLDHLSYRNDEPSVAEA